MKFIVSSDKKCTRAVCFMKRCVHYHINELLLKTLGQCDPLLTKSSGPLLILELGIKGYITPENPIPTKKKNFCSFCVDFAVKFCRTFDLALELLLRFS